MKTEVRSNTSLAVFVYNRTFGDDPRVDGNTIAAWDSIVPVGQGTVRYAHGSGKPTLYTLSAVHQLHCLWSIYQNYYEALHSRPDAQAQPHLESRPDSPPVEPHMRHCFDYLRQSLMCASDSTFEPVDPKLGGVTGWGTERVCRDYAELRVWAEARRVSDGRGFSSGHGQDGNA
ncbi:hypothetical protein BJY04DRAFT_212436 [Aspergillus karnatakaensis]|uniref:uncharacterized protein n=1 Tax=Aspergillus karnatakaensis TaxID=1810916 RepID=UPI003CCE35B6